MLRLWSQNQKVIIKQATSPNSIQRAAISSCSRERTNSPNAWKCRATLSWAYCRDQTLAWAIHRSYSRKRRWDNPWTIKSSRNLSVTSWQGFDHPLSWNDKRWPERQDQRAHCEGWHDDPNLRVHESAWWTSCCISEDQQDAIRRQRALKYGRPLQQRKDIAKIKHLADRWQVPASCEAD